MHIFYLWITVVSCAGFWGLWTFGFRPLILDRFRFEIEGLLIELDDLVATGCLAITSEVYQSQRATLQGLLKIAPRFGILQMALAHQHMEETILGTPADPGLIFEKDIANLQPYAQDCLRALRNKMGLMTLRFVLFRAPFIVCLAYSISFWKYITGRNKKRMDPVETLQREAYDASRHGVVDHVLA